MMILRNLKFIVVWVIVLSVISISVVGCTEDQKSEKKVTKVGAILPLTGPVSVFGQWHRRGMKMALEEVNENGEKRISIIFEDSKNQSKVGVSAFNKLANTNDVSVVISAMSRVSLPLVPLAKQAKLPLFLTDVTYPGVTNRNRWTFRYFLSSDKEARVMASYARDQLGIEEVALFYVDDKAGNGGASAFKSKFNNMGGDIVGEATFQLSGTDFRGPLEKLTRSNPDAVWIYGFGRAFGTAIKQLRGIGYEGTLITNQAMAFEAFRKVAGDAAEGAYFTMPDLFSRDAATQFIERYKRRWGSEPGLEAFYGYDMIRMIDLAMQKKGTDPKEIRSGLLSLGEFGGSFGKISVDSSGDIDIPVTLAMIKNNEASPLQYNADSLAIK